MVYACRSSVVIKPSRERTGKCSGTLVISMCNKGPSINKKKLIKKYIKLHIHCHIFHLDDEKQKSRSILVSNGHVELECLVGHLNL